MKKETELIRLSRLSEEHTIAFKEEMQEAFQHGFEAYNKDVEETNQWQVLPDKDFYQSLEAEGAEAYEAVSEEDSYTLRLRLGPNQHPKRYVWKKNGVKDLRLRSQQDGSDVLLQVPLLEGWNFGWIAIE